MKKGLIYLSASLAVIFCAVFVWALIYCRGGETEWSPDTFQWRSRSHVAIGNYVMLRSSFEIREMDELSAYLVKNGYWETLETNQPN